MTIAAKSITKTFRLLRLAGASATQLLWPRVCALCDKTIEHDNIHLCDTCWRDLGSCVGGDYCRRCGLAASRFAIHQGKCDGCRDQQFHFDAIARAGIYTGTLAKLIVAFKYGRDEVDLILPNLVKSAIISGGFTDEIDHFVPVPLHWIRRMKRGFNQSHHIAEMACRSKSMVNCDMARIRNTAIQPSFDMTDRAKNVRGAFAVRAGHNFKNKTICLVDDVKTTGATLNECASLLKQAGAVKVYAMVVAVTDHNFRDAN